MSDLSAIFVKKRGSKKFPLDIYSFKSLKTQFLQFELDLPGDVPITNVELRQINNIKLDKPYLSVKDFASSLQQIKDYLDSHPVLAQDLDLSRIYFTNKKLTKTKARSRFAQRSYDIYEINKSLYLYLVATKIDLSPDNLGAGAQEAQEAVQTDDILSIKKFDELQKFALKQQTELNDLRDGINSFRTVAQKALNNNADLQMQAQELSKQDLKLKQFLQHNFADYLKTPQAKADFLQNMLNSRQSKLVTKITNDSPENLLQLIKAVCDY